MFKKIIIILILIVSVSFIASVVVNKSTSRPYYYNSGMREGLDHLFPICPTSFSHPFDEIDKTILKSHEKPFSIGEGSSAKTNCSFSPYYFLLTDVYLISLLIFILISYWYIVIHFYKNEISKKNIYVRILYNIFIIFSFLLFYGILVSVIKLIITKL